MTMQRLLVLGLLFLSLGCRAATSPPPAPSAEPLAFERVFPRDGIEVLDQIPPLSAVEAASWVAPHDLVLGVVVGEEARAYPVDLLARHEVANDTLGGEPIVVTFCPLCNSGIVASRLVETDDGPQTLSFGLSGDVLDEALVLYDRETESLWPQSRAQAVSGPLSGTVLSLVASQQMPWSEWLATYPDSTVLIPPDATIHPPTFALPEVGATAEPPFSPTAHGYVIGVANNNGTAIAFPLETIAEARLINARLDGTALLVVAGDDIGEAWLWRSPAQGDEIALDDDGLLRDSATGTAWDGATGRVVAGEGQALQSVAGRLMHWQAWWDWYPQSEVWER